ncbi:4Fe-4S binding protein [Oceanispirochaeta sp.]|jgi:NAD-dependent dihydropyrimidine dehydrogenase PreA subunit|uniref:indolepyruvate ferredoxin oxidoreductase subunit alpha n=1 Tax=Oceanispirochaeta sp. TaxID=2035350 RepID=UPI002618CAEB|nr:4Fe-4S binding protein [Oceanispirochaeta sp.]MDA3958969.1 4Fe-4S binding protein [Oceanispirochaeta sp.]
MAYVINAEDCVNCGACEGECPVDAISEKDDARIIDADLCTSCGACADVCPTECILEG